MFRKKKTIKKKAARKASKKRAPRKKAPKVVKEVKVKVKKIEKVEEVKIPVKVVKRYDTLGGSPIKILKIEKMETGENKIYLIDGSITVLTDKDLAVQINQLKQSNN